MAPALEFVVIVLLSRCSSALTSGSSPERLEQLVVVTTTKPLTLLVLCFSWLVSTRVW